MKTESILLQTLCVPCGCHCRYCLLSWDGHCPGAAWERSAALARRMAEWLRKERPELRFHFSFGYSMEHPQLPEALDLLRALDSVQAEYLQCDGLRIRDARETVAFVEMLREHGVRALNFTYYGAEDYHDRFAGRKGDFAWMQRLRAAARAAGLETSVGVPLTRENAPLAGALLERAFEAAENGSGRMLDGKARARLREALIALRDRLYKLFGLEPLLDKFIITLSSGELRKFQLTRTLLSMPRVLVLDNPFIGLDAPTRDSLSELLGSLAGSLGLLLILVLPRPDAIPGFITHVIPVEGMEVLPKVTKEEFLSTVSNDLSPRHFPVRDAILSFPGRDP